MTKGFWLCGGCHVLLMVSTGQLEHANKAMADVVLVHTCWVFWGDPGLGH